MMIQGTGVGGHCLPKDFRLLKYGSDAYGTFKVESKILQESRLVNDYMLYYMRELIEEALNERDIKLEDAKVCILGFTFLENSNNTRNTPSVTLYNLRKPECDTVVVHDPFVSSYEGVNLTSNIDEAQKDMDCIAVATRHREYLDIELNCLKNKLATPVIFDSRNVFHPTQTIEAGFTFRGIGIEL